MIVYVYRTVSEDLDFQWGGYICGDNLGHEIEMIYQNFYKPSSNNASNLMNEQISEMEDW